MPWMLTLCQRGVYKRAGPNGPLTMQTKRVHNSSYMEPLERAIVQSGGIAALARQLDVSTQSLHHWRTRGLPTSEWLGTSNFAKRIESATGIPAAELLAASRVAKGIKTAPKRRKAA